MSPVCMELLDSGDCRGLSSCDSKITDSPGLDWQGLGSQCLAPGCPLGLWRWLLRAFPTFQPSLASLYSCFQPGPVFSAPREQTCGDRASACSFASLGKLPQDYRSMCLCVIPITSEPKGEQYNYTKERLLAVVTRRKGNLYCSHRQLQSP